ncbi:CCA tRNA nucleotidyltransferase, partial [Mycobacterium tuberculosis]|nr:CCA tRNA nucleotidyltransferase [Mycobacterium tuberculosis]
AEAVRAAPEATRTLDASWLADPKLVRVFKAIGRDGDAAWVVGGAVRNALMGVPVADIDLATTALPETVMARARAAHLKPVPTGIDHGTVTVVVDGTPFEVTTLRADVETHGRHATVAFGRDWSADAHRRDFT